MLRRWFTFNNRKGFTAVEVLFSLFITLLVVMNIPILISNVNSVLKLVPNHSYLESGAYQLAITLHDAQFTEIGNDLVYQNYNKDEFSISLNDNRVVKQPGFTIFLSDVEYLNFYELDHKVYMFIKTNTVETVFLVGTNFEDEQK